MPVFSYRGKNLKGDEIRGYYEAREKALVATMIRQKGYHPIYIEKKKPPIFPQARVGLKELAVFFKQFSTMLDAGITAMDCLHILESQTKNKDLKKMISEVIKGVSQGDTLSESFENHSRIITDTAARLIEIGEYTGRMGDIFGKLTLHFEGLTRQREKIKTAMLYPTVLGLVSIFVVSFLVSRVLPVFSQLFFDSNVLLPLSTRMLLSISEKMGTYLVTLSLFAAALYLGLAKYKTTTKGALRLAKLELNIPVFGTLKRKSQISLFCTVLSLSLSSGAPMLKALEITKGSFDSEVFRRETEKMQHGLKSGRTLADVMERGLFSNMLEKMVRSGEETGNLEEMLNKAATLFDEEIEELQERISRMLEPAMILVMSVVVGFIVISVTLPMFSVYSFY